MNPSKTRAPLICLMLFAIFFIPTYSAFQGTISVLEEKNISLNLPSESDYNISKNVSMSMVMQAISINSTKPVGKNASIMLMSMNMLSMNTGGETQLLNQSEFSNVMENIILSGIRLTNGREINSILVNSPQGKNVTLHVIRMPTARNELAKESIYAFWDLDQYTHAILTSDLDLNATASIVKTLKIVP